MQRPAPSSRKIPLGLGIVLLVAVAGFCFVGAIALGIGIFYLAQLSETAHSAITNPSPETQLTPGPTETPIPESPTETPTPEATVSATPFSSITPFKAITPSGEIDEFGFPTIEIQVGTQTLEVELAETREQQTKGLRFRQSLAENAGMLFMFSRPQRVSFWMKDASIPLSMAFIEADGKIVQIRAMKPYDETPVPSLSDAIVSVLAVNQGWFERNGIAAGTVIEGLPKPQ